jgi:hypothetical protein
MGVYANVAPDNEHAGCEGEGSSDKERNHDSA